MIKNIVPTPKKIKLIGGKINVPHFVSTDYTAWEPYLKTLSDAFEKLFEHPLEKGTGICLSYDPMIPKKAYRMDSSNGIVLSASDTEGLMYAMASLILAVDESDGHVTLEKAMIEDYPDKDYRSIMVDIGREWHPLDKLMRFVDLCFLYKVRYLNLHFADNKLYTLPSKAFPKLNVEGKYYTEEDIAALRAYAKARGVVLVPEFECPGHAPVLNT